ncbi:phospholipase D-like domain-containing protein [Marinospirillum alkaliphilum]|uniref:Phosphatidylserine/phosphatidylglycerophosphate/cardiolipin synthase n=1 Tax=Marinospirillum alkaliphilum DSM 21637 TaxID=1122209 RepID=A0A1K1VFP7_9GAMM|nr:phosphatidylserine/phosphatidylglycerophosphate/cardiolipin synthase family protein [Marinospirillum alkaliphilum]SFX23555.1 Phosphatidylserine/phosphatidylglycerophosphate/cardiolipin synthase [Marinospirillum alkaliphilum DSM 21637]
MIPLARHFSWRSGHHTDLLIDGRHFFPDMLQAIEQAQDYVLLEVYLAASGRLMDCWVDALITAAARGVRVCVLLDGFGAASVNHADRQKLVKAGVRLNWFNPLHWRKLSRNLMRDHRKLLLVDGHTAWIGGFGLTNAFDGADHGWHEVVLKIMGPCVGDWQSLFWHTWHQARGRALSLPACQQQAVWAGGVEGRVVHGQGLYLHAIKWSLIRRINQAQRRIWLATPYFVPTYTLRKALRRAALRGVEVHLLLPGPITDHPPVRHAGRRFYNTLLQAGVRIYEYQPRFIHAKVSLCDDWVSIGSCNFDHWGMHWNLEANQEVESEALARRVVAWFESAREQSLWLDRRLWRQRPRLQRIKEYFWGMVDALVQRLR